MMTIAYSIQPEHSIIVFLDLINMATLDIEVHSDTKITITEAKIN